MHGQPNKKKHSLHFLQDRVKLRKGASKRNAEDYLHSTHGFNFYLTLRYDVFPLYTPTV